MFFKKQKAQSMIIDPTKASYKYKKLNNFTYPGEIKKDLDFLNSEIKRSIKAL